MLNKLLIFTYAFIQSVDDAKDLLSTKEVTIIGVLLFIIMILLSGLVYLFRRNEKMNDSRLEDHKEFTKELLNVTEKTENTVRQVNEILKIIQKDVQ